MKARSVRFVFFFCIGLLFVSCKSTKSVQKEFQYLDSELYYDLTSKPYEGERLKTIALIPINWSGMDYPTAVKRKRRTIIPLILFNSEKNTYEVTLGEQHFYRPYALFLSDALLAECNRSACFYLNESEKEDIPADYYLHIDVLENKTIGKVKYQDSFFLPFTDDFDITWSNHKAQGASTEMELRVRLTDDSRIVYEHIFPIKIESHVSSSTFDDTESASWACLDQMSKTLSEATKQIVEGIRSQLSLFILSQ